MRRSGMLAGLALAVFLASAPRPTLADATPNDVASDCFSDDSLRRIPGCTALLEGGAKLSTTERSLAHAMRALAYSLQGHFSEALKDYDEAIQLKPDFDVALNNRAWALFKMKRYEEGMRDVERALKIAPWSAHAFDTRAHLHQVEGRLRQALQDYILAMRFGGEKLVKLYQCGLEAQGLFKGKVDGLESEDLRKALAACVRDDSCDPLPPEEECRRPTS
ncbi:MAG: tetratricopeptide repeat protein [Hyphomicrobiaceae bacterium]